MGTGGPARGTGWSLPGEHPTPGVSGPPTLTPISSQRNAEQARADFLAEVDRYADRIDPGVRTARAWLWQHTAQPNGDPWEAAAPDELDRAARDLAATLAGGRQ